MSIRTTFVLIAAILVSTSATAEMSSNERAIETSTYSFRLPDALPNSVSLAPCDGCSSVSLSLNADTRFYFGRRASSLEELRKLATGRTLNVSVYYDKRTLTINRLSFSDPSAR